MGPMTLSITIFSIMVFSIMTVSVLKHNTQHNGRVLLCCVSFTLCVDNKLFMLSVVMQNVVMLSVVAPQDGINFISPPPHLLLTIEHKLSK